MLGLKQIFFPIFILTVVVVALAGTSLFLFYQGHIRLQQKALIDIVQSQARLIESVARFNAQYSQSDHVEGARAATLAQVNESNIFHKGWGESGEFTIAEVSGGEIHFLNHLRSQGSTESLLEIVMDSPKAEPMRRALQRKSGTLIGIDYRGEEVLAAYEWLEVLEVGLVAKIDLSEVHSSFLKDAALFLLIALLLMLAGSFIYYILTRVVYRSLEESEERMQLLLESSGEAIFGVDTEMLCTFANPMCLKLLGYGSVKELLGKNMHELIHHHHEGGSIYTVEQCKIAEVFKTSKGAHIDDEVFWHKEGHCFPVEYHSYPIIENGVVTGVVINFNEITARKEAEKSRELMAKLSHICLQANHADLMMEQVLELILSEFNCDRAWLLYPCDPNASEWNVPVERTKTGWSGAYAQGKEIAMDDTVQALIRKNLDADGVLVFDANGGWSDDDSNLRETFSIRSQMTIALTPKFGLPWMLGIHHCEKDHCFTALEQELFGNVSRRLTDTLDLLLSNDDLEKSQVRLAEAQHMTHMGNWELNLINDQLYWSDEIFRIFEVEQDKFGASYDAFLNAIYPDDRDAVNAAYTQSLEDKLPYEITHRLKMEDGRVKYVNERCKTIYDESGQAMLSSGTVQDITERIEREQAVQKSEIKFSQIFHGSNDAIIIHDLQGNILEVNDKAGKCFNYSPDEMTLLTVSALYPPEALDASRQAFDTIQREGQVFFETYFMTKTGVIFPAEVSSSIVEVNGEQFIQAVVRDISERKKAEALLRKSETLLREAQSIGKLGGWEWDVTNDIVSWSDEVHNIFGVPNGELNFEIFMQCVHPDDRAMVGEQLDAGMKEKGVFEYVFRIIHPDGEIKYLRSRAEVQLDENNEPVRLVGVTQDITEQKAAEDELGKYRLHLEELVAARTRDLEITNKELESFSYSVSHDLRAPLRAIDGFSRTLLEDYQSKLDKMGCDYLLRICAAAQRMDDLIDDMLSLSKVTRHDLQLKVTNMSDLAADIMAELQEAFPDRTVEKVIVPDVMARGDSKMLRIAMTNLLGNAWKYTARNADAKIEFGLELRDGRRVYYVKDNGVGFDMVHSGKLFGAFQRLHGRDEFEGTGVGLATVQRIIHRHGGRIWAEAEEGKGACFYFVLDRSHVEADN